MEEIDVESIKTKVMKILEAARAPITSRDLLQRTAVSPSALSLALSKLYKEGAVRRIYTEEYDPTRPFDTVSWVLAEKGKSGVKTEAEDTSPIEDRIKLVMSIPLSMHATKTQLLNSFNAVDFLDAYVHVIELAQNELRIMCPVIDAYGIFPIMSKITKNPTLTVRTITELSKSKDLLYLLDIVDRNRFQVADAFRATKINNNQTRKISGVHTKMIVADDEAALVGSFNFSRHHYLVNFDLGFLIYDRDMVKVLSRLFDDLWSYVASSC